MSRRFVGMMAAVVLSACATIPSNVELATDVATPSRYELKLLGQRTLEHKLQFGGTTVGGLSGIDYDPIADLYYLISDDRSAYAPARFYAARMKIDEHGFHDVTLQKVVTLLQNDGTPYPKDTSDTEAIRFDGRTGTLWYTSEGARKLRSSKRHDASLIDPFVRRTGLDGRLMGELPLDPMFRITSEDRGPRDNLVFEGLTLAIDGRSLWVSMEGPLIQDGPMPTMRDGAWSRISRYDRDEGPGSDGRFGPLQAQYAYRIDPIPAAGAWTSSYAQNGVSEILASDATHMFVLERALVVGAGWRIRLFEAGWHDATDIRKVDALAAVDRAAFTPMSKQLVLDFDTLGIRIDNLEGLCFGPTLANGHRTLVLVSDDNFNSGQITQLLALEIIPR
jgi:hypothetical protein